ncbi:MAG: LysM peptidoglycan-binding domain-containing protein [Nanoarchaeota archaeon]|nr:LysM peptidoglycan-binding domain-containing protein [Nanoarchaeota archaeon]
MTNQNNSSKRLQALFFPQSKEENEKPIHETPILKITNEAYKKINLYSKIVSEIFGGDIECGGRMLNYTGMDDGIIRDAYLQYQRVNSGDGDLMDNPSADKNYIQQRGMSWAGMWHSHGGIDPFHSGYDNNRLEKLHDNNKHQRLCTLKSNPKGHYQRKTVRGNKLILEYDLQPLSFVINFDSNEAAKAAAENIELHDEVFYTPSLVINKDEYLNDGPCRKYYAEFLAGNGKDKDVKVKDVKLELVEENNNIIPSLEEMVLEVGEKVRYAVGNRSNDPGIKLKNYPNYNKVLEKYKGIGGAKNSDKNVKPIEQIVSNEKTPENPSLQTIIQDQQESVKQEIEHNNELCRTKTYMEKLEGFYDSLNSHNDLTDKMIAELCRAYSGKQDWLWNKRFEKGNRILKELKKKCLTLEQKNTLENIKKVISSNKYLKINHSSIYQDLQRRLDTNNSNFYCNLTYWKDNLSDKLRLKKDYNSLEEKIQNTDPLPSLDNSVKQYKRTFGSYLKGIAKYVGIAALAIAVVLLPAKYCSKDHYNSKPSAVYTVKKGDSLWNLSKEYLKKKGISLDNNLVYKVVDKVALENGKGKQADYKVWQKDKKNPHLIHPGDKIKFSKKVLDNIKKECKK